MQLFSKKKKNEISQKSWQRKGLVVTSFAGRKKDKGRRKFSRFLFWPLLAVFLGICAYLLLFSPFLLVDNIVIEGNQDVSSLDISRAVENSLNRKYFKVFDSRNYFLVNMGNISGAMKSNFDRLEVGSVEKHFPGTIFIRVIERKAEIVWCSAGVCYFVDKDGLAYGGAAGAEDEEEEEEELRSKRFLVVVDDGAIPVEIGKTVINPDYIGFIEAADAMIRDDLKLEAAESYHTPGTASREIGVKTVEGWILKISSEYSIDEAKKTIQMLFEKDLNEETRKNLDYLDLRIKGKIYYKMK